MRVLYCTDTYPPQVNGVSVVTALSVAGLTKRSWDCAVVSPRYPATMQSTFDGTSGGTKERELTTLPSMPLPIYPETRLCAPNYAAVARAIRHFKPDLVHAQTEFVIGRMGQMAASRAGIPIVTSYHTDFAKYIATYGYPSLASAVSRYISRFHRRVRRTYTPSTPARDYLHSIGVANVQVWGRGVDTKAFAPSQRLASLRRSLNIENRFTFLYVGRLAAEKGVEVILSAYDIATKALPANSIHLVIAGGGPQEKEFRERHLPPITYLGYLDRQHALPALFASCDSFLFSSTTETLGLVVLEAMSCGLPVIATPAGGVADHLRDDVNGLAYPARDAQTMAAQMIRLAQSPALAARLGAGARHTAEALSWELEYDRLDHSYREVLASVSERLPHAGREFQPVPQLETPA